MNGTSKWCRISSIHIIYVQGLSMANQDGGLLVFWLVICYSIHIPPWFAFLGQVDQHQLTKNSFPWTMNWLSLPLPPLKPRARTSTILCLIGWKFLRASFPSGKVFASGEGVNSLFVIEWFLILAMLRKFYITPQHPQYILVHIYVSIRCMNLYIYIQYTCTYIRTLIYVWFTSPPRFSDHHRPAQVTEVHGLPGLL